MTWIALATAAISLMLEVLKIVREIRADKKEERIELTKKKTEAAQSVLRGIVDGDESRIISGLDRLRHLRS